MYLVLIKRKEIPSKAKDYININLNPPKVNFCDSSKYTLVQLNSVSEVLEYESALKISEGQDYQLHMKLPTDTCFVYNYFDVGLSAWEANIECLLQEAAFHIMSELWLRKVFPAVVNVNSNLREKRVKTILTKNQLSELPEGSKVSIREIWPASILSGLKIRLLINFSMHLLKRITSCFLNKLKVIAK